MAPSTHLNPAARINAKTNNHNHASGHNPIRTTDSAMPTQQLPLWLCSHSAIGSDAITPTMYTNPQRETVITLSLSFLSRSYSVPARYQTPSQRSNLVEIRRGLRLAAVFRHTAVR